MAKLAYNPQTEGFQAWYDKLVQVITDEGADDSFAGIVRQWTEYCQEAEAQKIFTGSAAEDNFNTFKEVNDAFRQFFQSFGEELGTIGSKVAETIAALEQTVSTTGAIDIPSFNIPEVNVPEVPPYETSTDVIRYDTEPISILAQNIGKLNENLEAAKGKMDTELARLDSGEEIWDGAYAASFVNAVTTCLNNNIPKIKEDIDGVSNYLTNTVIGAVDAVESTQVTAG